MPASTVTLSQVDTLRTGLDDYLGGLETDLETTAFNAALPVIGAGLEADLLQGDTSVTAFRGLAGALDAALSALEGPGGGGGMQTYTAQQVADAVNAAITGAGFAGVADVTEDSAGALDVKLNETDSTTFTQQLASNFGLGQLGFSTKGAAQASLAYTLTTTVSVDPNLAFTAGSSTTPVLKAAITATAPTFSADATLGPAQFTATDAGTMLQGAFDITGAGTTTFTGDAKLAVKLGADVGTAALPSLSATLDGSWSFDKSLVDPLNPATFGGTPGISLDNVMVDPGQFFDSFVKPILDKVEPLLAPVQQVLNVLNTDLGFLKGVLGNQWHLLDTVGAINANGTETGDGKLTLLDLIKIGFPGVDFAPITRATQAIQSITSLVSTLDSLNSTTGQYNLGSFNISGDIRSAAFSLASAVPVITQGAQDLSSFFAGLGGGYSAVVSASQTVAQELVNDITGGGAISLPGFTPASAFGALLGQTVNLVDVNVPQFSVGFGSIAADGSPTSTVSLGSFPIVPGITVGLAGALTGTLAVSFGYDTSGLQAYAASGFQDPSAALLDGLWVSNPGNGSAPILQLQGSIGLNVDAGISPIADLQGGGNIGAAIDFYLAHAGKNYLDELAADGANGTLFFDRGQVTAGFNASASVLGVKFFSYLSPRATLLTFGDGSPALPTAVPQVTSVTLQSLDGVANATTALLLPGHTAQLAVTFDRGVMVQSATLLLNDGGTATYDAAATAATGSDTSIVFDYKVLTSDASVPALVATRFGAGTAIVEDGDPANVTPRAANLTFPTTYEFSSVQVDTAITRTFTAAAGDFGDKANFDIPFVLATVGSVSNGLYGDVVIAAGNTATYGFGSPAVAKMESLDVKPGATLLVGGETLDVSGSPKLDTKIEGELFVGGGGTLQLAAARTINTGVLELGATAANPAATLMVDAQTLTFSGGGTLTLADGDGNRILAGTVAGLDATPDAVITLVNQDNLISGSGSIGDGATPGGGLLLVNDATVQAAGKHALKLYTDVQNAGTLGAVGTAMGGTPAGGLELFGHVTQSGAAAIVASSGGQVVLEDGSVVDGTALGTPGGGDDSVITSSGHATIDGTVSPITLDANVQAGVGSTLTVLGTVNGLVFADTGPNRNQLGAGAGILQLHSVTATDVDLTGQPGGVIHVTGTTSLAGSNAAAPTLRNSADLRVDPGATLAIGSALANQGSLLAGGMLAIQGMVQNAGGLIGASNAGSVTFGDGTTILGGDITQTGTGTVQTGGAVMLDGTATPLRNLGVLDAAMGTLTVAGRIAQHGDVLDPVLGNTVTRDGTLLADGTTIILAGVTLQDGTLASKAGGSFEITANSTLASALSQLDLAGLVQVQAGTTLTLNGNISNTGTLELDGFSASAATATLLIQGDVTLGGGGAVSLLDGYGGQSFETQVVTGAPGATLDNTNNTISGYGQLGTGTLTILNRAAGVIDASGQTLVVDAAGLLLNEGTLEATTGTLQLHGAVTNYGGTILAAGGEVMLSGASIIDGLVSSIGGATVAVDGTAYLAGSFAGSFDNASNLAVGGADTLSLSGPIGNSGTITLSGFSATSQTATLQITGTVDLSGGGLVTLVDGYDNQSAATQVVTGLAGSELDNLDNTIRGSGQLGQGTLTLVNGVAGTVQAATGTLELQSGTAADSNAGLMEAAYGGTLLIDGRLVNSGTIRADNGGTVLLRGGILNTSLLNVATGGTLALDGGIILGGLVSSAPGSNITVVSAGYLDGSVDALALAGTTTIGAGAALQVKGDIANSGTITIAGFSATSATAGVVLVGTVSLSGEGTVTLADDYAGQSAATQIVTGLAGSELDNIDNTITGYGQVGAGTTSLVNEAGGTVQATHLALTLDAGGQTTVNHGLMEAVAGGTLVLDDAVTNTGLLRAGLDGTVLIHGAVANAGGTVRADAGGTLKLDGGAIEGGGVVNQPGGAIEIATTGLLDGTLGTLTLGGTTTVDQGATLSLTGVIANTGTIALGGFSATHSPSTISITGTAALTGDGMVVLQDLYAAQSSATQVITGLAGSVLDNQGNTITGYGQLGNGKTALVNEAAGTVRATTLTLAIDAGSTTTVNHGLMEAVAAGTLELDDAVTNTGTLRAGLDGTVLIHGAVDNTGGTLRADAGGTVVLDGAKITGGSVAEMAGGTINVATTALLDGAGGTLTLGGTTTVLSGATLSLQGAIANAGTLAVGGFSALSATAALTIVGRAVLDGGGQVVLRDLYADQSVSTQVIGGAAGSELDNVDNTITGYGQIGNGATALTNEAGGTVQATHLALTLDAGGQTTVNHGLMEAVAGGTLVLDDAVTNTGLLRAGLDGTVLIHGAVANAGGTVRADAGGTLKLDGGAIEGGGVVNQPGGAIEIATTGLLDGTLGTLTLGGTTTVDQGATLSLTGVIANTGTIALGGFSATHSPSTISITGTAALTGDGMVVLQDLYAAQSSATQVITGLAGSVLDNQGNTITGYGQLGNGKTALVNEAAGTVRATTLTLAIDAGSTTTVNHGLMEAVAAGTLELDDAVTNTGTLRAGLDGTVLIHGAVDNTGGTLRADAGGTVVLDGAKITGGSVAEMAGGTINVATTALLDGAGGTLTLGGTTTVLSGATLSLQGAIANAGTLAIGGFSALSATAALTIVGKAVLDGGGRVVLRDLYADQSVTTQVIGGAAGSELDNVDNTITGYGQLGNGATALTNEAGGIIDATALTLTVQGGTTTNHGTMQADGGTLDLASTLTNTGTVRADAASTVRLRAAADNTGTLTAAAGGTLVLDGAAIAGSGTLSDDAAGTIQIASDASIASTVTQLLAGTTSVEAGATLTEAGTLDNTGVFGIFGFSATAQTATLSVAGILTLAGGGTVQLRDLYADQSVSTQIVTGSFGSLLVNHDNTVLGYGALGNGTLGILNQAAGVIDATANILTVDGGAGGITNQGLMRATGGTLQLQGRVLNTGTILADGNQVLLAGTDLTGGTLASADGGLIQAVGSVTLTGVGNAADLRVANGDTLVLSGSIHNTDQISLGGFSVVAAATATLTIANTVTLDGGGRVVLRDLYADQSASTQVISGAAGSVLDNVDNTITGYGQLGNGTTVLTNEVGGTIDATALTLTVQGGTTTNHGTMQADGATLLLAGAVTNNGVIEAINNGIVEFAGTVTTAATIETMAGGTIQVDAGGAIVGSGALTGTVANQGMIEASGGTLTLSDAASGRFTVDSGATLRLLGGLGTANIALASGAFLQVAPDTTTASAISNFSQGDQIDLYGFTYIGGSTTGSYDVATGLLDITNGTRSVTLSFGAGNSVVDDPFHFGDDGAGGTIVTNDAAPACYCPGTAILTASGERPVEALAIGDLVVTADGRITPIRWIGRRSYAPRFVAANPHLQPVRIRAGAVGRGLPHRDLLISPKHAMLLDGHLVPAEHLVNGGTIVRERTARQIDYLHIELDRHDTILAEGAASETFLDDNSRTMFHNAHEFEALYPGAPAPTGFCAPRVESGYQLEAIRRRLAGLATSEEAAA